MYRLENSNFLKVPEFFLSLSWIKIEKLSYLHTREAFFYKIAFLLDHLLVLNFFESAGILSLSLVNKNWETFLSTYQKLFLLDHYLQDVVLKDKLPYIHRGLWESWTSWKKEDLLSKSVWFFWTDNILVDFLHTHMNLCKLAYTCVTLPSWASVRKCEIYTNKCEIYTSKCEI